MSKHITKEMLARCQDELKQALCALPDDVQKALAEHCEHAEVLKNGVWAGGGVWLCQDEARVYHLSPDTPTEPGYEEFDVTADGTGGFFSADIGPARGGKWGLFRITSHKDFASIIYRDDNGVETLRTSIDASFGTPVRVRMRK